MMEGITGIIHRDILSLEAKDYDRGRKLMTADAVVAVRG
jgi:D-aminopeptidase